MDNVSTGLRDLAEILRSPVPNPMSVEQIAGKVASLLFERRKQLAADDSLMGVIKNALELLCYLTVDGRAAVIDAAMSKAIEMKSADSEIDCNWRDLAQLPTFDMPMRVAAAERFEWLAARLSNPQSARKDAIVPKFTIGVNDAEIALGGKTFARVDREATEALQKVVNAYPRSYGLSKDYQQPKRLIAKLPDELRRCLESTNAGYFYLPPAMSDA